MFYNSHESANFSKVYLGGNMSKDIIEVVLEEEVKKSYLTYAMSVIVSRALPDVRDGLKPVQRRILYTMYELGLTHNSQYKKCARIVGDTLGKYHPHGDASVYEALVRMAQDFNMRYPLINGQGNFGSIDGDPPAAMRYSEAKMEEIAEEMLRDIDKETVNFRPNFDNTLEEPEVLPGLLPNLLVNGSSGIAVGMATNIPPHNLREVVDATIYYIENPNCEPKELLKYIKGPDFPTGGVIVAEPEGFYDAYLKGNGKVIVRAKLKLESLKGKSGIIITEIPFQIKKSYIIERIADLVKEGELDEISDIRDESDRDGIRIVIELKRGVNPSVVINKLYRHTPLQESFSINMLALVNNEPKVLNIKDLIHYYVEHRKSVVTRRTRFELRKSEERLHIVEGLLKALANIDEVVKLIRNSESPSSAKKALIEKFELSDIQAQSILDMKLQKLTTLEVNELNKEKQTLVSTIQELKEILLSQKKLSDVIKNDLIYLSKKYGDERKTEITFEKIKDFDEKELIQKEDVVVIVTDMGMIKRIPLSTYRAQKAGGRGIIGTATMDEDRIEHFLLTNTHEELIFFTDRNKAYALDVYKIPESSRLSRGTNIRTLIGIAPDEKIKSLVVFDRDAEGYIVMISRNGYIKKVDVKEFKNVRQSGIIALETNEDDVLQDAIFIQKDKDVVICTSKGLALRTSTKSIRPMGRSAKGVIGIRLSKEDKVISLIPYDDKGELLAISSKGYSKRTKLSEFNQKGRGSKGIIYFGVSEKTGDVVSTRILSGNTSEKDIVMITSKGMIIRMSAEEISVMGRSARGIKAVNLKDNDEVVDIEVFE